MRTDHHARAGLSILFTAMLFVATVGACACQPKPRPTSLDPSNPAAPESPPLALATLTPTPELAPVAAQPDRQPTEKPPAPVTSGAEHGHHHGGSAAPAAKDKSGEAGKTGKQPATVYTCPVHPEVTSDKPGNCPKCGMKLAPREPAEGKK